MVHTNLQLFLMKSVKGPFIKCITREGEGGEPPHVTPKLFRKKKIGKVWKCR